MCKFARNAKIAMRVPLMVLLGALRLLGFILALTALVNNVLAGSVGQQESWGFDDLSSVFLIHVWKEMARIISSIACLLIMADTLVATDRPLGNIMDEFSFLYLLKVPPSITRGVLWLLMLAVPCTEVVQFFSVNYNSSVTTAVIYILNTGRKVLILPIVIYVVVVVIRNWSDLFKRGEMTTASENHWRMKRYYEDEQFKRKRQRPKQRVEKLLLLLACLLLASGHAFNILTEMRVVPDLLEPSQNDSTSTSNADSTQPEPALVSNSSSVMDKAVDSLQNIIGFQTNPEHLSVARLVLYHVDTIGNVTVHIFLTILLAIYFIKCLSRSEFLPVHTVVKALHFYNLLVALPSNDTVTALVQSTTALKISKEASLWVVALLPVFFLLQALPYIATRSPYTLCVELKDILKSCLTLVKNFISPKKLYRLFHALTMILGVSAFILLLLGLTLPWMKVDFQPNESLGEVFDLHDDLQLVMRDVVDPFRLLRGCISAPDSSEVTGNLQALEDKHKYCFGPVTHPKDKEFCPALVNAVKNASSVGNSLPKDCLPTEFCPIYISLMVTGFALAQVPFCGPAGTMMMKVARIGQKLFKMRKKFLKVEKTFLKFAEALQEMKIFFKRPIATHFLAFSMDIHLLAFLIPCMLVGIFCVSVGFWKRQSINESRKKLARSFILFLLMGANFVSLLLSLVCKSFLVAVFETLPLITVEVTEFHGWHMLKVAFLCSTIAAFMLWIYSIVDVIYGILRKLYPRKRLPSSDIEMNDKVNTGKYTPRPPEAEGLLTSPCTMAADSAGTAQARSGTGSKADEQQTGNESKALGRNNVTSMLTGFIRSTRVWFVPLFSVLFAALVLYRLYFTANVVFKLYPRVTGKMGTLLQKIHTAKEWSAFDFAAVVEERTACSLITSIVILPFLAIFNVLKTEVLETITGYDGKLAGVFVLPESIDVTAYRLAFVVPVVSGILLFVIGFIVSALPCLGAERKSRLLLLVKRLAWTVICLSINLTFSATKVLSSILSDVPMLEVTVATGPVIHYSIAATLLLVFAFIELCIGEYGPIK